MPFGYLLQRLRDEKGLSQRQLGQIAGIHHSHIDRLEHKEKSPSVQTVEKLVGGLGLAGREAWLLGFVAKHHEYIDVEMVRYALEHPEITEEEFSWAVAVKYRRSEKLDYPTLFACASGTSEFVEQFLNLDTTLTTPRPALPRQTRPRHA